MRIDREIKFSEHYIFIRVFRARVTCINPKYQPRLRGIRIFSGELRWNPRTRNVSYRNVSGGAVREKKGRGRQAFSDLQDTSRTRISDLRSTRQRSRDQIWRHCKGQPGWADSCFPGSRPPGASTSNKTIPYDLYLWALRHLIAAAREGARGIAHTESFRAKRPRRP